MSNTGSKISGSKKNKLPAGQDKIVVRGARTHNLKNITVEMPRNAMIAITGLSGSGKSSLAFDTIFAEGQRRYVESLSAYARQFLHKMQKPDVDEISGLSPAISIDQKSRSNNPRSTVATITEIYDYLRVLFARVGVPHCLVCDRPIKRISKEEILETILRTVTTRTSQTKKVYGVDITTAKIRIYAPVVVGRKGEYYQMLYDFLSKGYERVRIDGTPFRLREQIVLEKNKKHDIDLLVDEIFISEITSKDTKTSDNARERLSESLEKAIEEAGGLIKIEYPGAAVIPASSVIPAKAGIQDSKNSAGGNTLDSRLRGNDTQVAENIKTSAGPAGEAASPTFESEANKTKGKTAPPKGAGVVVSNEVLMSVKFMCPYDGFSYPEIEPRLFSFNSPYGACPACNGLGTESIFSDKPCPVCKGARLRDEALHVLIEKKSIVDITSMSIEKAIVFFRDISLTEAEKEIAKVVLKEIGDRLSFMANVGIEYLTLDRRAHTLSGGEAQRIRLASQLGSGLVG
ncbi:MAG: excinuclease ABC subunit UvrA, partial [Candidatus Paceibacterota bacterium]